MDVGRHALERAQREIERGRLKEAIEVLERSLKLGWESTAVRTMLGIAYARTRQVERAFQHLDRAVAQAPDAFAPRCALGELYLRLCIADEARHHLRHAAGCATSPEERAYAQRLLREGPGRDGTARQPFFAWRRRRDVRP
jgi:Flp pilus assembly protein TadD